MNWFRRAGVDASDHNADARRPSSYVARQEWLRLALRVLAYALYWLALGGLIAPYWPGYRSWEGGVLPALAVALLAAATLILAIRGHPRVARPLSVLLLLGLWGVQGWVANEVINDTTLRWWHMALALGSLAGLLSLFLSPAFVPSQNVRRRAIRVVAALGTGVAVLGATLGLELDARYANYEIDRLSSQTAADIRARLTGLMTPFSSLAERWSVVHHFPDDEFRRYELRQLLAQHPELQEVVLVSPNHTIAESFHHLYGASDLLAELVATPAYVAWQEQLKRPGVPRLALPGQLPGLSQAGAVAVIGVTFPGEDLAGWTLLARVNLTLVAIHTLLANDVPCCWRIDAAGKPIFISQAPMQAMAAEVYSMALSVNEEANWRVAYHPPLGDSTLGLGRLPEGILIAGLLFTLFLNASQRLAALARFHAERIRHAATHDALTGLYNRRSLAEWLAGAVESAARQHRPLAVAMVQVRGVKAIISTFGHEVGDQALQEMARRLHASVPADAVVARVGDGDFVLAVVGDNEAAARERLERLLARLAEPVVLANGHARLRLYAGLRMANQPQADGDGMRYVRDADLALLQARQMGPGSCVVYTADLTARFLARQSLRNDVQQAIEQEEFQLHYQPIVDARTGRVRALEALLRWEHPERGKVSPSEFVPLAEETGQIVAITDWCLRAVCRDAAALRRQGIHDIPLSLNISAHDFRRTDLVALVKTALDEANLPPQALQLEITESVLIYDHATAVGKLHRLQQLGIVLALDDFGTGYSSLNYLKQLPIGKIKIDRCFVEQVTTEPRDAAIVQGILTIARQLQITVVAEGVETEAQLAYLTRAGCDELQGFMLAPPQPLELLRNTLLREPGARVCLPGDNTAGRQASYTLLALDDDSETLANLVYLLRHEHYRIITAATPEVAYQLLAQESVQVALVGQHLGMGEAGFLERLREIHPQVVRMMVADNANAADLSEAVNRGAVYRFVLKPWNDEALRRMVRDAFRHYDEQQGQGGN